MISPAFASHGPMLTENPSKVSAIQPSAMFAIILTSSVTSSGETYQLRYANSKLDTVTIAIARKTVNLEFSNNVQN